VNFYLHHRVKNGSGAHPASNPLSTTGFFPGGRAAGAWSWPLTPSSAEVKMRGAIPPLPQYVFMAWCSGITLPLLLQLRNVKQLRKKLVMWSVNILKIDWKSYLVVACG
jgi:hypothetical protein